MLPSRRTRDPGEGWRVWAAPLFPLAIVALGGATARWSQGVALVALGALLLASPPRAGAGWGMHAVLGGLLSLAAAAFLPEAWFPAAAWRTGFEEDLATPLAWTHTPQPWVTAENLALFLAGVVWFYLNWTRSWNGREMRRAAQVFGAGAAALAGAFVLLRQLGVTVPIWPNERHFGPFPNRNQTADFLAVSSLLILGHARLEHRGGRPRLAAAWGVAWLVTAWGVFGSYSRAGIAILFLGTAAYLALELWRSMQRRMRISATSLESRLRRFALAAIATLALVSGFLLLGGDTLERFRPAGPQGNTPPITADFRLRIQRDAVGLADAFALDGVGLGNFGATFPFFRQRSALPARAIHPESDYLWLAGELGWGALALTLAGCALVARRVWPPAAEPERALRAAAALGVGAFALHGLVDVSGHRFGTVFSAIFLMGLALRPAGRRRPAPPSLVFRSFAAGLIVAGGLWLAAGAGLTPVWPGAQGVERLKAQATQAAARRDFAAATRDVDRALEWAPLDWTLYFARASADLGLGRDTEAVATDFRRARYLEPFLAEAPITEAKLWATAGQSGLAVNALAEACRREPAHTEGYVGLLFAADRSVGPGFRDDMAALGRTNPAIELPFYEQIAPPESVARIAQAVQSDPDLKRFTADAQRTRFFRIWAQRGDVEALAREMARRPEWQKLGWRWWADARARAGDLRGACEIVQRFAPAPKLPPPPAQPREADDLRGAVALSPDDPALALQLYYADPIGARAPVRWLAKQPRAPHYFHWLDAQGSAAAGDWAGAWQAWERYLS